MKFMGLVLGVLIALVGCKEITTTLRVQPGETLRLKTDGGFAEIPEGEYPIVLKLTADELKPSVLKIRDLSVDLYLPTQKELLHVLEPQQILAEEVGQAFDVLITREVGLNEDQLGISLYSQEQGRLLATAQFVNKLTEVTYNKETGEFLKSYQTVKSSQRGVLVPIDGDMDNAGLSPTMDGLVNFTAMLMLAPWVKLSYSKAIFILGKETEDDPLVEEAWRELVEDYPVIDYFPFTHGGVDEYLARPLHKLPKKEHQLRFVYTEGCHSGSAYHFIKEYNAAATAGHRSTSVSPLFAFSVVRAWALGHSAKKSIQKGWKSGKVNSHLANLLSAGAIKDMGGWDSVDDMINSSELMMAWTPDLEPHKIFINRSAVVSREGTRNREIFEARVSEFDHVSRVSEL